MVADVYEQLWKDEADKAGYFVVCFVRPVLEAEDKAEWSGRWRAGCESSQDTIGNKMENSC